MLFSTIIFSSPSQAKWTKASEGVSGHTHYIDFERIRNHDGFVYFWMLSDYIKPIEGNLSEKNYRQADCELLRFKILSGSFHKEPMGYGTGDVQEVEKKGWRYPPPMSVSEITLT